MGFLDFSRNNNVKFSKLRNPTGQFFQSNKQQSFCNYISAIVSKVFVKIDIIYKNISIVWTRQKVDVAICNKNVNEKKRNSLKKRNNHQNLEN